VALYSSDASLKLDLLHGGFQGIAVIPEAETGGVRKAYSILPINADLIAHLLTSWQT